MKPCEAFPSSYEDFCLARASQSLKRRICAVCIDVQVWYVKLLIRLVLNKRGVSSRHFTNVFMLHCVGAALNNFDCSLFVLHEDF